MTGLCFPHPHGELGSLRSYAAFGVLSHRVYHVDVHRTLAEKRVCDRSPTVNAA